MKIICGSRNPAKLEAVSEGMRLCGLSKWELLGMDCGSGVSEQPRTFEETLEGARNRATAAWKCESDRHVLGVGLEDGVFPVSGEENRWMNVCQAVLTNGERFCYGSSSAFMLPGELGQLMHQESLTLGEALNRCGYVNDADIGKKGGAVSVFTRGRLKRSQYIVQAVHNLFSLYTFEMESW